MIPTGTVITAMTAQGDPLTETTDYEPGEWLEISEDGVVSFFRVCHPEWGSHDLECRPFAVQEPGHIKCPELHVSAV